MRVEADCYLRRKSGENVLKTSHSIAPGCSKEIDFLGPRTGVRISVNEQGRRGVVLVESTKHHVSATIYEDRGDEIGTPIEPSSPIEISNDQRLALRFRGKKPKKAIIIKIDPVDGEIEDFLGLLDTPKPLVKV